MNWVEYYRVYLGLKLHFESSSYDYTKYGKKKVSEDAAQKKYLLLKSIEGKHESLDAFEDRLISLFRFKSVYINELYSAESQKIVNEYVSSKLNQYYLLESEFAQCCDTIAASSDDNKTLFKGENEYKLPKLLTYYNRGIISYHTITMIDSVSNLLLNVNPMFFSEKTRMNRYSMLQSYDKKKIASIMKNEWGKIT